MSFHLAEPAVKRHSHARLSVGCLAPGSAQCHVREQDYWLNAGDIVVIPPCLPHSCNPPPEQSRSYHMLYLDAAWYECERNASPQNPPNSDIVTYRYFNT
ncbi:AraC family ligand binding domain-containing protein [Lonsdalea iberica]|uniref:AraC family ligand binding domain-containing protein n=1 Tax=Lonsdalea iberica TaxID=1082703 RepID=UPI000B8CFBC3|nr:AraC family ligand binding domain-containing protein [Lonsdalea iberica]